MRNAQIDAATVYVICPACGENQINTDDSEFWTPDDVANSEGTSTCQACDEEFRITPQSSAPVRRTYYELETN